MNSRLETRISKKLKKDNSLRTVSFDVFDTILHRIVPSDYVTYLAAKLLKDKLDREFNIEISKNEILENRKTFNQFKAQKKQEWTIGEWLSGFASDFNINQDKFIQLGKKAEIEAEMAGNKINPEIKPIISKLKRLNKRVIAISDIWLGQEELSEILHSFGFIFDAVYTSGSMKASKKYRAIYRKIKNIEKNKSKILHIGDNLVSDFINSRLTGWDSFWLPKRHPFLPIWLPKPLWRGFLSPKPKDYIIKILNSNIPSSKSDSPLYEAGYYYLAPLLILFSLIQWKHFTKNKVDHVFFIARDAKLPFEVFKKISEYLPSYYNFYYCRLSRRSMAILHPRNFLMNAEPLPGKIGRDAIGEWISNFTIKQELKNTILNRAGVTDTDKFDVINRQAIKEAALEYKSEIDAEISFHAKMVRDYFKELTGNRTISRIGIVDSGWAGTIQDCLSNVFQEAKIISGVYLGVSKQGINPTPKFQKYGILRDDFRKCRYHNPLDATAGAIRVWDTLLREPVSSVLKLEYSEGRAIPVLGDGALIGNNEEQAFSDINNAIAKRMAASSNQIRLLSYFIENLKIAELEEAASNFSKHLTIYPSKKYAKKILNLNLDEGSAAGQNSSIGIQGLRDGIAWYPGIIICTIREQIGYLLVSIPIFLKILLKKFVIYKNNENCNHQ